MCWYPGSLSQGPTTTHSIVPLDDMSGPCLLYHEEITEVYCVFDSVEDDFAEFARFERELRPMYRWTPSITRETIGCENSSGAAIVAHPSSIAVVIGGVRAAGASTVSSSYTRSGSTKVMSLRRTNRRTAWYRLFDGCPIATNRPVSAMWEELTCRRARRGRRC